MALPGSSGVQELQELQNKRTGLTCPLSRFPQEVRSSGVAGVQETIRRGCVIIRRAEAAVPFCNS